jgi:hypothetical protein
VEAAAGWDWEEGEEEGEEGEEDGEEMGEEVVAAAVAATVRGLRGEVCVCVCVCVFVCLYTYMYRCLYTYMYRDRGRPCSSYLGCHRKWPRDVFFFSFLSTYIYIYIGTGGDLAGAIWDVTGSGLAIFLQQESLFC